MPNTPNTPGTPDTPNTPHPYTSDIAFTPAVKAIQRRLGSRPGYAAMEAGKGWSNIINDELAQFIAQRDSFYLGTTNAQGQPYIQHRGGKAGFLKVIDPHTLGFADFKGNSQYISIGNLSENPKAFLFLMDYPHRHRLKIWGNAQVIENDPALLDRLTDTNYPGKPQRAFVFHVLAWDVNCPQHIRPRRSDDENDAAIKQLRDRVKILEEENQRLRAQIL